MRVNQKNPRRRYGKYSKYKFLQVLECFCMDMPVFQTAKRTRINIRSLRDTYNLLREKMVTWAMKEPAMFNGFGYLLFDNEGYFETEVLEFILSYSKSKKFKKRLRSLYPRYDSEKQPIFMYAMEFFIRKYTAMEAPRITKEFRQSIQKSLYQAEIVTSQLLFDKKHPQRTKKYYWALSQHFIHRNSSLTMRFYPKQHNHNRIFSDLKIILLKDPL